MEEAPPGPYLAALHCRLVVDDLGVRLLPQNSGVDIWEMAHVEKILHRARR